MSKVEVRRGPSDGRRAPGECVLTRHEGQLFIERADPRVWMDDGFLQQLIGSGYRNEWVALTYQPHDLCEPLRCCQRFRSGHCYYGALVTIRAVNETVIYRIGGFLRGGFWEAELAER